MHELSVVRGILGIIERERKARGFSRVRSGEVQCGHYSCITEESLRFCFEAAAVEPHLRGASLSLVRLPARFECPACEAEFDASKTEPERCPACGAPNPSPRIVSEILVRSLEVDR